MEVIPHYNVSAQSPSVSIHRFLQSLDERLCCPWLAEHITFIIAAIYNVIDRTGELDPELPSQSEGSTNLRKITIINISRPDPVWIENVS